VTGVSGSGKSTLAFDILFAEGQRRYLESLNAYARQFVPGGSRPDVDAIYGIPPHGRDRGSVTSRGGRKSTVGTLTEGPPLPEAAVREARHASTVRKCEIPIEPQSEDAIVARLMREYRGQTIVMLAPLVPEPQRRLYRPREMGGWKGLYAIARRRQIAAGPAVPAHRPLQGAHHRVAGGLREGQSAQARRS